MACRIKLPKITGFRVTGFEPIYASDIEMRMNDGAYVILGGNGLGKTTLLQAVVYGLAGGTDETTEDNKSLRWSSAYFRSRLSPTQHSTAQVEVDFMLGDALISVRRGFRGSAVIAVRQDGEDWRQDNADEIFSELLSKVGGYLDPSDFTFVVHRLLYLPENRRLIAWDTDAQIRLLMLLNQDITVEKDFRQTRAKLKMLDSKKRHLRVAINKAHTELSSLLAYNKDADADDTDTAIEEDNAPIDETRLPALVEQLKEIGQKRTDAERRHAKTLEDLSRISDATDQSRSELEDAEAGLVKNFLSETERELELAIGKLLDGDICPCCGRRHAGLADLARRHLHDSKCVLCGSDEKQSPNPDVTTIRKGLDDRVSEQQALEDVARLAEAELSALQKKELNLQSVVSEIRYKRSMVAVIERDLPKLTVDNLKALHQQLEDEEADAEVQIRNLQQRLEKDYKDFRKKMDSRTQTLRSFYSQYATSFLGLKCDLEQIKQEGLLELQLFVPKFNDIVRPLPESCSEAQRFFLDIAFRIALIDLANTDIGQATFFCETPETALDVSYIENVVTMFTMFSKGRNNVLLTANIQSFGIAERLFARVPKKQRPGRLLNLLLLGRLSSVQTAASKDFKKIMRRMMSSPVKRGRNE